MPVTPWSWSIGARIRSPSSGCVLISVRSSSVSGPGLSRIEFGIPILPMSWKSAPSSSRFSASYVEAELAVDAEEVSVIQWACEEGVLVPRLERVRGASTVERKVRSRLA